MKRQGELHENFIVTYKKAHLDNLIGVKKHDQVTFLTSSEDSTMRLWDIRIKSSVKLIKNKELTNQITNPTSDGNRQAFIGSNKKIFSFDLRQEGIFIQNTLKQSIEPHLDDINRITYSEAYKQVSCCDDEGDIRVYEAQTLKCLSVLDQQHTNMANDIQYVHSQHKDFINKKVCVSGGFDSTLIIWDMMEEKPIKKISIAQIFNKYEIKTENPAFIHKICCHESSVVMGLQSGHIMCVSVYQPRKPKFIMAASLDQITTCSLLYFQTNKQKKYLVSGDTFNTFSIFDFQQRINHQPKFLIKYKTEAKPLQIQSIGNSLLVACVSPSLSIFSIKG